MDFFEASRRPQGVSDQFAILNTAFEAVGDFNPEALAIAEIILDFLGQVRHVDHDLSETMLFEELQQELHHRFLQDRNHRFRDHMRDRLYPGSLACGQDHGLH